MSLSITIKSKFWMPESMETKFEVSESVLGERCCMGEECEQPTWCGARMETDWKWAGTSWGALWRCWVRTGTGRARPRFGAGNQYGGGQVGTGIGRGRGGHKDGPGIRM